MYAKQSDLSNFDIISKMDSEVTLHADRLYVCKWSVQVTASCNGGYGL